MFRKIWSAFKSALKSAARAPEKRRDSSAPAAPKKPSPFPYKHKEPSAPAKGPHQFASPHHAAHMRNSGPPAGKWRGFDRVRGAQMRMKRYTRAR